MITHFASRPFKDWPRQDVFDGISFGDHIHCIGLHLMLEFLDGKDERQADLFNRGVLQFSRPMYNLSSTGRLLSLPHFPV